MLERAHLLTLALLTLCMAACGAWAQTARPPAGPDRTVERLAAPLAADPAREAQVMAIAEELRCLVCQNETIAASHAALAVDLRRQIRLQLAQGRTHEQILDFMVARYGDFVLYRPPLKASTVLLWVGPFALLLVAAAALARTIARRRKTAAPPALDADEARRARRLLGEGDAMEAGHP